MSTICFFICNKTKSVDSLFVQAAFVVATVCVCVCEEICVISSQLELNRVSFEVVSRSGELAGSHYRVDEAEGLFSASGLKENLKHCSSARLLVKRSFEAVVLAQQPPLMSH